MKSENNEPVPETIKKLASKMANDLKYAFDDYIKVRYDPDIAYKYCEWGLLSGYKQRDINKAFNFALFKCHVDATAVYTSNLIPGFKSELSSTISLARETLEGWLKNGRIEQSKPITLGNGPSIELNDNTNKYKL